MCGICGVMPLDGPLDPAIGATLPAMTAALGHRGPDGSGTFNDGTAALGHRRLAIIDRAGGAQPMANEDRSCWIVFNGEIYNHAALRRRMEARGCRFRSASDTETILRAYEEYGTSCVDHLEGMFAFAVYDARRRELLLARDRLGKKPLFYAVLGGALHFASEIKAIRQSPAWDPEIDPSGFESYLSLGYFVAPRTVYRHVRKLEPGHWLRMRGGRLEIRQYWDVTRFDDDDRREPELLDEIDSTIAEAVHQRLESEVPLGAFLSGGIDSGLIVSYMAQAAGASPITTSVGFDAAAHNELGAAALTAARFGTVHHAHVVEPRLDLVMDGIAAGFDEPFADPSAVPTFYVSQLARRHVTVALSGDGGDESFGGYGFRYVPHGLEAQARRLLPSDTGRRVAGWLAPRWPRAGQLPRALRLGSVLDNLSTDPAEAYYTDLCFMKPPAARRLLGLPAERSLEDNPVYADVTAPYRRCPSPSAVQRAQYADLKIYLPNDVLVKVDRMSMAHGVEVRSPLLDRKVVELAFRIPAARKMPRLRPKHLLRQLAARRLPQDIASLPKRGFTAPAGAWLAGPLAERFASDVFAAHSASASHFDLRAIRALYDDHRRGRADHWFALWAVWMFERWAAIGREREAPCLACR